MIFTPRSGSLHNLRQRLRKK